jgi:polysaccharide chain length determinant protein (PEP-CTERM system associated)
MLPGKTYTPNDYAMMAWRRRWIMVGSLLLGTYAGLIVSSRLSDMYQSEMLIQVVPQRVPDDYVRSTVTMRTEDRLSTLTQQVLSRTALESLIRQLDLYPKELAERPLQDVVELMRLNIKVDPVSSDGRGAAFYVRFTYSDAEVATRVTERLGGLFIDLNARDRGDLAEATDEFLESQLDETRKKLEEQEQKLERFRQENAGRLPTQLSFNMQAMQNVQMSIQALVESLARDRDRRALQERLYNNELEAAQPSTAATPQQVQSAPGEGAASGLTTEQQLAVARETLARLQLRLTPEHPDIARTTRQIRTLEERLKEEASSIADAGQASTTPVSLTRDQRERNERLIQMRAELDSLDREIAFKEAEEQRQRNLLTDYQRRIEEVPGVESEWIKLTRDYDTQQAAYRSLLTKSESSKVAVQLERRQIGEQFRVLDPARLPIRPTGIKRVQVNGLGALGGLFLGIAVAALLEFRDTAFRTSADVSEVFKLPVVALVPYVMTSADHELLRRRRLLTTVAVGLLMATGALGIWRLELWKYVV